METFISCMVVSIMAFAVNYFINAGIYNLLEAKTIPVIKITRQEFLNLNDDVMRRWNLAELRGSLRRFGIAFLCAGLISMGAMIWQLGSLPMICLVSAIATSIAFNSVRFWVNDFRDYLCVVQ
jgi:hypothetical protein